MTFRTSREHCRRGKRRKRLRGAAGKEGPEEHRLRKRRGLPRKPQQTEGLSGRDPRARLPQNKIYEAATSYASGYEITKDILREDPSVDGIIYSVDLTATGGLRALLESGRKVPEDISVIGVDNSIYAKISYPQLTSLDNNAESQSKLAVDLLIKALNNEPHERSVLLKTHIVERETT